MIDHALQYLLDLIGSGWEYPDAEWKTTQAYGVNADELRREYDNYQYEPYRLLDENELEAQRLDK